MDSWLNRPDFRVGGWRPRIRSDDRSTARGVASPAAAPASGHESRPPLLDRLRAWTAKVPGCASGTEPPSGAPAPQEAPTAATTMQLDQLPVEMLMQIGSHLRPPDLKRMVQASAGNARIRGSMIDALPSAVQRLAAGVRTQEQLRQLSSELSVVRRQIPPTQQRKFVADTMAAAVASIMRRGESPAQAAGDVPGDTASENSSLRWGQSWGQAIADVQAVHGPAVAEGIAKAALGDSMQPHHALKLIEGLRNANTPLYWTPEFVRMHASVVDRHPGGRITPSGEDDLSVRLLEFGYHALNLIRYIDERNGGGRLPAHAKALVDECLATCSTGHVRASQRHKIRDEAAFEDGAWGNLNNIRQLAWWAERGEAVHPA